MNAKDFDLLRRSDLFRFLPDEHFEKIRTLLQEERHDFGDLIVKQGEPASAFYILISGRARVVKSGSSNGEEIVLGTLRPGDSFGEAALTEGGTRSATVRCSTSVEVLRLDRGEFLALTETAPEFKEYIQVTRRARTLQSFLYEFSNFGRLPTPALREVIEKLERVQFRKGNLIIKEGDSAGPMYILEKGRARAFTQNNGAQVNLAFYRDGDFFVELSILNGSPRAASVEAYSDCDLLALDPDAVRSLKQSYPEFGKLLEERLAQYKAKTEARIPLDFTEELVPAETLAHNKVALDGKFAVKEKEGAEAPFADDEGHFRKRKQRVRKFEHITQIDEMDCGAASLGMVCRHFGRKVSLARIRQLCHTATDGTSLKALCRAAVELGLAARALKVSLRNLPVMPLPAIIFVQLAAIAQEYLLAFAAVRLDTAILDFLSRQLLSLPMSYFTSRRTGDIQRRLDGARQVRQFAVQHGVAALLAMVHLLGAVVLMALYSAWLTLAFLATIPLYAALMYFSLKVLRPLFAEVEESQGKYSSHQIDAIKGIEAVKAASAESVFRDAMLNEFLSVSKKIFRSNFVVMSYDSVLQTIGLLSTAIFLWVGANQVINGHLSVGGFVAFSSLTAIAYAAILRTLGVWDNLQLAAVLMNRLNDIFEQEPEQGRDRSRLTPVRSLEGRIELRNVSFRYGGPEAPNILSNITLDLAPGRMIAFVGRSGCGKTTLVKLIAGLLEPTEGPILFDHLGLKHLN